MRTDLHLILRKTPVIDAKPGDELWYRNSWGIPIKILVDFCDWMTGRIVGCDMRGAFVSGPVGMFRRTIEEC